MPNITYNEDEDKIYIAKSQYDIKNGQDDKIILNSDYSDIEAFISNEKIKALAIHNFIDKNEFKGYKAEDLFKKFLEENSIPSLYIGQSPNGISFSSAINNTMSARRPDFLVNFPNIGNLFFDVKCRTKIKFKPEDEESYFYLGKEEIDGLINLNDNLLIPVWIAFIDIDSLENQQYNFYLLPISKIKSLVEKIKNNFKNKAMVDFDLIKLFRIPDNFLSKIETTSFGLNFNIGIDHVADKYCEKLADTNNRFIDKIERLIKDYIENNSLLKTHLINKLSEEHKGYMVKIEITTVLDYLINNGTVIYEQRKPLKLRG